MKSWVRIPQFMILARSIAIFCIGAMTILGTACARREALFQLQKGKTALENHRDSEAGEHCKIAVDLDATLLPAKLCLATAYLNQYMPGDQSSEHFAASARDLLLKVLDQDPKNTEVLWDLSVLAYNHERFDEDDKWLKMLSSIAPGDARSYSALAGLAYVRSLPAFLAAERKLGLVAGNPGHPIKDKRVKQDLMARYGSVIDNGLRAVDQALKIDPKNDAAMEFRSNLIRLRADLVDDEVTYEQQIKIAEDWFQKALMTRQAAQ